MGWGIHGLPWRGGGGYGIHGFGRPGGGFGGGGSGGGSGGSGGGADQCGVEPVPSTGSYCSMQQAGPIPSPNFPMYYPSAADLGGVGIMSVMACPAVAV